MSLPSTPAHSAQHSNMSSPMGQGSDATPKLTPRSKIRALLQDSDDDSDKENSNAQLSKLRFDHSESRPVMREISTHNGDRIEQQQTRVMIAGKQTSSVFNSADDDTMSEEDIRLNTGKLAARMKPPTIGLQHQDSATITSKPGKSEPEESAYERVRRQLQQRESPKKVSLPLSEPPTTPSQLRQRISRRTAEASSPIAAVSDVEDAARVLRRDFTDQESSVVISPRICQDTIPKAPSPAPNRLQELLARKRQERLNKESAAQPDYTSSEDSMPSAPAAKKTMQKQKKHSSPVLRSGSVAEDSDSDQAAANKLTQQARPTRKASKKAVEELKRETQRMSRNMQLTHEARTKTKFTTTDFFKRMNFRQPAEAELVPQITESDVLPSASASSDIEAGSNHNTPPSSPPSLAASVVKSATTHVSERLHYSDDDLPSLEELMTAKRPAVKEPTIPTSHTEQQPSFDARASLRKLAKSVKPPREHQVDSDDDDLEIETVDKASRLAVFDQIPASKARESHSIHVLRALAHLNDQKKPDSRQRKSMTASELRGALQRRARQQALLEKAEKIQDLKDRGIIVQTEEERERDQLQLESMLDKARQEAQQLGKKEKEAAKRDGKDDADGALPDDDDDDEDEDFEASDDGEPAPLSGSEDEFNEEEEEEIQSVVDDNQEDETLKNEDSNMLDNEAVEDADDESEQSRSEDDTGERPDVEMSPKLKRKRRTRIVSDDEDEDEIWQIKSHESVQTPQKIMTDAFGFGQVQPVGLSQIFGGTMADSQTQQDTAMAMMNDPLVFLQQPFGLDSQIVEAEQTQMPIGTLVEDSQNQAQTPRAFKFDSPMRTMTQSETPRPPTQIFDIPDATQDMGFQAAYSPLAMPSASYETVCTVMMSNDSPLVHNRGRLRRGRDVEEPEVEIRGTPEVSQHSEKSQDKSVNAFDAMRKAAEKKVAVEFDKKKSDARDMVDEQAEESEDEYAGLGGASDDESQGEIDEETRKLIDDDSNEKVDERDVAAYFAEKARVDDEKSLEKLYKDINNGGLRRKRGAELDLIDSDDEDEVMARRRAAKQREFAKMRKALLADGKLGKIAENPKQQAFLKAVEDRNEDDDFMILDMPEEEPSQVPESQDNANNDDADILRETTDNQSKGRSDETIALEGTENRPPFYMRRTGISSKPASLAAIRTTLSEIIGQPETILDSQEEPISIDETHNDDDMVRSSLEGRRSTIDARRSSVIDRMALKRQSSSSISQHANPTERLAFQAPTKAGNSGFRIPSLLRRATSNASTDTQMSALGGSGLGMAIDGKEMVRMGGSKKSSINYHVREQERRTKLEAVEKEKMKGRERVGKMRRSGTGLKMLAGGSFD